MKSKILNALLIAILLSACGVIEQPDNYNQVWLDTQACTGLTASKPDVEVIPDIFWDGVGDEKWGRYFYKIELIALKESHADDPMLLAHEFTHHLLKKTYGDYDSDHINSLFAQCGYAS